uniref:Uncharacterized protein n=1 Tax=Solanum tuberosum TaxID=4113 RepID=M1DUC9_SOLTU
MTVALALDLTMPERARQAHAACVVIEECYLVDPSSSHMVVSKIKPCICVHRSSHPFCRQCVPGLNWLGYASGCGMCASGNVGQWQVALAKAYMLWMWHVQIGQAMATLAIAYSHQPGVIDYGLSASARRNRPWHANIGCGLRASARRHRPLSAHIGGGLRA